MRGGPKTLIAALAALLLAVGLAACGSGGGAGSTAAEATSQAQSGGKSSAGASPKAKKGGEGRSAGSGEGAGKSGGGKSGGSSGGSAANFVPKHHSDSGGGSKQFEVKGGDNSIQEFGSEAGESELDEAAAALHNFLDARAEGNWAAACEYMSKSVVESFEKLAAQAKGVEDRSCAGILEALTNPAAKPAMKAEAAKANVRSLRVEGERSFVIYTGTEGTILAMPMANEGGSWKVASLAGTPLN